MSATLADIFYNFHRYKPETPEGRFFDRMQALDITTIYPLLLFAFDRLAEDTKQRNELLADLESYLVRRMVCGLTTKNYNRILLDVKIKLKSGGPNLVTIAREHLLTFKGDSDRWPDDDEFFKAWRNEPLYRRITRPRLRMILESLEMQTRTGKTEDIKVKKNLTIEHLMPQAWPAHWPLPNNDPKSEEMREAMSHTIGNLTRITNRLNPALSNSPWVNKRKEIIKHSVLVMNAYFQDKEEWNEEEIGTRSRYLFGMAKKIWARPE